MKPRDVLLTSKSSGTSVVLGSFSGVAEAMLVVRARKPLTHGELLSIELGDGTVLLVSELGPVKEEPRSIRVAAPFPLEEAAE